MADQTQAFPSSFNNPVSAGWNQFWQQQLQQGTKPVSGNALQSDTQSIHEMGSPNLESSAGSGFASGSQGPSGGGFNPQSSLPSTPTSQIAANTAGNSSVGSTSSQTSGTANDIINTNQSLINPQSTNKSSNANTSGSTGLSSGVFSGAVSAINGLTGGTGSLASQVGGIGSSITNGINNFGVNYLGLGSGIAGTGEAALASGENSLANAGSLDSAFTSEGVPLADAQNLASNAFNTSSTVDSAFAQGLAGNSAATTSSAGTASDIASTAAEDPELAVGGTSLLGVLGGAGAGYGIGSIYGSLTGLGGSNATNADIGGALGGAAGIAGGAAASTALGLELGSAAGPIGMAVGAVAGAILGGLFGSGTPTNADTYNTTLGAVNQGQESSKNPGTTAGFGQAQSDAFANLATQAGAALGFTPDPNIQFGATISTQHPGAGGPAALFLNSADDKINTGLDFYTPGNVQSTSTAYYNTLVAAAASSGYTDTTALHNWFYGQGTNSNTDPTSGSYSNVTIAPQGASASSSISPNTSNSFSNVNIAPQQV